MRTELISSARIGRRPHWALALFVAALVALAVACGETTPEVVRETVVVEKPVEKVIQQTVLVEKPVEKIVKETVVVEKPVEKVIVIATPTPFTGEPPRKPIGSLVVADGGVGDVASGLTSDCPNCSTLNTAGVGDYVLEMVRGDDGSLVHVPNLAESWKLAPDQSYTDFTIRQGVPFYTAPAIGIDFGELTAEDVAWTFNMSNPTVTPESIHDQGGELQTFLADKKPAEVVGDRTVRVYWKGYSVATSLAKTMSGLYQGIPVFSKRVFEEKGADWTRDHPIGTGPFTLEEWTVGDRLVVNAVPDHWRYTPHVARVTYLAVKEAATRRAMLESGEADLTVVNLTDWPALLKAGSPFKRSPEVSWEGSDIVTGGNYWEKVHPTSGTPLDRPDYSNLPWVGNPDKPETMERSRKVRWALSLAIDRDAITEGLFDGLTMVSYLGGVGDPDSVFQSNIENWKVPFDPDRAKKLLVEAGYPDGFSVAFYAGASKESLTGDLLVQAIAADWKKHLNVKVDMLLQPYQTYRPIWVNRDDHNFSFRGGGSKEPSTWSNEWYASATGSNQNGSRGGGFNSGFEFPKASEVLKRKSAAKTQEELVAITKEWIDFLWEEQVWIGVVEIPSAGIYNSKRICDWKQPPWTIAQLATGRNLATARLCDLHK